MLPFMGRVPAKQFKNKPNLTGIKVFVCCSSDGLAHDFDFYQGKVTGVSKDHSHLGLGGSVMMRLVETLLHGLNMTCYMVPLFRELKFQGILASKTIRANRSLGCDLTSEKELKKQGRRSYDFRIAEEEDVVIVRWYDNGPINMLSTVVGLGNITTIKRWSEATKQHVDIDCPQVITEYNQFTGGVEKLDFLMSLDPLLAKTKKWPMRVISQFIGFAVCKSWLEYIRDANAEGLPKNEVKDVMEFQSDIARSLIASNMTGPPKRGKPSTTSPKPVRKSHVGMPLPTNSTRFDGMNHRPIHVSANFPQRCRTTRCVSKSQVHCRKYGVYLCLSAANDCFFEFHTKK